jgi:hypothetical protein
VRSTWRTSGRRASRDDRALTTSPATRATTESPACVRCGAPRGPGTDCPRCGVVYAKAERPPPSPVSAAAQWARQNDLEQARAELRLARFAVPGALLTAVVLVHTDLGKVVLRTLFGMWLHESGHAAAAWMCGHLAFPGPWFTPVAEERSFLFALAISAGLGFAGWRAWASGERVLAYAAGATLALQWIATFLVRKAAADVLIYFAGDAGMLVFGAALMAAFFVPPGHKLHRDWLRWGFLVIGAASFADAFSQWWAARRDLDAIPFGEIEGGGDTDPTVLLQSGWTVDQIVGRYVTVGVLALIALFALQVWHERRTRAVVEGLEREQARQRRSG